MAGDRPTTTPRSWTRSLAATPLKPCASCNPSIEAHDREAHCFGCPSHHPIRSRKFVCFELPREGQVQRVETSKGLIGLAGNEPNGRRKVIILNRIARQVTVGNILFEHGEGFGLLPEVQFAFASPPSQERTHLQHRETAYCSWSCFSKPRDKFIRAVLVQIPFGECARVDVSIHC